MRLIVEVGLERASGQLRTPSTRPSGEASTTGPARGTLTMAPTQSACSSESSSASSWHRALFLFWGDRRGGAAGQQLGVVVGGKGGLKARAAAGLPRPERVLPLAGPGSARQSRHLLGLETTVRVCLRAIASCADSPGSSAQSPDDGAGRRRARPFAARGCPAADTLASDANCDARYHRLTGGLNAPRPLIRRRSGAALRRGWAGPLRRTPVRVVPSTFRHEPEKAHPARVRPRSPIANLAPPVVTHRQLVPA